jgi:hypothetical protein
MSFFHRRHIEEKDDPVAVVDGIPLVDLSRQVKTDGLRRLLRGKQLELLGRGRGVQTANGKDLGGRNRRQRRGRRFLRHTYKREKQKT